MADLFDALKPTIQERFEEFDRKHPAVYEEFRRLAEQLLANGREYYSADAILHVVRYHRAIGLPKDESGYRLNDHYSSRFARKLMSEDARFANFFELRTIRTK